MIDQNEFVYSFPDNEVSKWWKIKMTNLNFMPNTC